MSETDDVQLVVCARAAWEAWRVHAGLVFRSEPCAWDDLSTAIRRTHIDVARKIVQAKVAEPGENEFNRTFFHVVKAMRAALRMGGGGVGMEPRPKRVAQQFQFLVRNSLGETVETHEVVPGDDSNLVLTRAVIPGRTLLGDLARGPDYALIELGQTEPKTRFRVDYRRAKSMPFDRLAVDSSDSIKETVVLVDCRLTAQPPQRAKSEVEAESPPSGD